jgi:hypothetical protein
MRLMISPNLCINVYRLRALLYRIYPTLRDADQNVWKALRGFFTTSNRA